MLVCLGQLLLLLVDIVMASEDQFNSGIFRINPDKIDTKLDGYNIRTFEKISPRMCFDKCLRRPKCHSYNYNRHILRCELNFRPERVSVDDFHNEVGFVYVKVDHYRGDPMYDTCLGNPCKSGEICENKKDAGGVVCVKDQEGDLVCRSSPCENKGICAEVAGGFKCKCPDGYTGDTCSTRDKNKEDCKRSTNGFEYKGMINTTINHRTCQRWDSDTPHGHSFNNLNAENYCRNPDNEPKPWCYTTDLDKRWEICDIPFCTTPAQECVSSLYGEDYFGTVRQTKNGIPCQKWSDLTPHSHSYDSKLKDQDDYCRNPAAPGDKFPWCYTIDPDIRSDICDIPRC
ncbi:plasminogen-like isoform X1 [Mytilus galloprovincialis]|uniref:plasminogen-like isoform X1 n=1 Tax=Mytilus galloprovincialis TaxID=29158 RepID=UPI003F7BE864